MTTFTTDDRIQAEVMYETIKKQELKMYELERLVDFWKLKCEFLEKEVKDLHDYLLKIREGVIKYE